MPDNGGDPSGPTVRMRFFPALQRVFTGSGGRRRSESGGSLRSGVGLLLVSVVAVAASYPAVGHGVTPHPPAPAPTVVEIEREDGVGEQRGGHAVLSADNADMSRLSDAFRELPQAWPRATSPRPIVVIGAGSIVRDAHLPVYARLGFPVAGIFDVDEPAARERAQAFGIERVFSLARRGARQPGVVFDVAVPPQAIAGILERMPQARPC